MEYSTKGLVGFCLALFQRCEGDQKQDPCPWGLELLQGALLSRGQGGDLFPLRHSVHSRVILNVSL